jgi:hypothetical protein
MARQYATSADFELVGMSEDPTPGDPDLIQGILQRYSDIGDEAQTALDLLKKGGAATVGTGSAMDALRKKIGDDLPDKLTKTATSYQDASAAYRDYVPRLQEAQHTFDRAVEMARSAAPQANLAPPTLAPDATDDEKAAAKKTRDAIDASKIQLSAARSLAEQAQTMRQTAQRSCADVLDRAAGEAIPERNIFQKIFDFFKENPLIQILLGIVIGIVSVFFPVFAVVLGGLLFAVVVTSEIVSGHFKLGDLLVGLLAVVPGGSVLKFASGLTKIVGTKVVAPMLAKVAPTLAEDATRGVKRVEDTIKGIKSSLNNHKTVGPLVESTAGKVAVGGAKGFGNRAIDETTTEALNGGGLKPAQIAEAAGGGLLIGSLKGKWPESPFARKPPSPPGSESGSSASSVYEDAPEYSTGSGSEPAPPPEIPVKTAPE